jgi:hypothetical protein
MHDQLAVVEAALPGEFFGRFEELKIAVDEKGFTRVDPAKGATVRVALEPKPDASWSTTSAGCWATRPGDRRPPGARPCGRPAGPVHS